MTGFLDFLPDVGYDSKMVGESQQTPGFRHTLSVLFHALLGHEIVMTSAYCHTVRWGVLRGNVIPCGGAA